MRAVRHTRAPGSEALAPGMILAHDVRDSAGRIVLAKGEVLGAGSISQLQSLRQKIQTNLESTLGLGIRVNLVEELSKHLKNICQDSKVWELILFG